MTWLRLMILCHEQSSPVASTLVWWRQLYIPIVKMEGRGRRHCKSTKLKLSASRSSAFLFFLPRMSALLLPLRLRTKNLYELLSCRCLLEDYLILCDLPLICRGQRWWQTTVMWSSRKPRQGLSGMPRAFNLLPVLLALLGYGEGD